MTSLRYNVSVVDTKKEGGQMKGEIIYSKYDSNEVTEALDFVLDTRDKLFFDNIFQYSKWGCVHGGTYNQVGGHMREHKKPNLKKLMPTKFFRNTMLFSFPICILFLVNSIGRGGSIVHVFIWFIIWCSLYWNWLSTDIIPIYQGSERNMILWEDRTDHKDHLWCVPEYYHFFGMIANYNLYKEGGSEVRKLGDLYAEAARDLSWLRCLCLISEDIRNFADSYGEENIEIAFRESEGECIIEFTGTRFGDPESVIPVEEQAGKRSFTVPALIVDEVAGKFREQGILDLSTFDGRYESIDASHIIDGRKRNEIDFSKMLASRDQKR